MKMAKIFMHVFVLAGLFFQIRAHAQTSTSKVEWYSLNMGFGVSGSTTTSACVAIGQPFVGTTQNASTQIISGFLVHPFIAGVKTAIEDKTSNENTLPTSYELEQNYPNPFNPSTTIAFVLPKSSEVTLKIFDASGRDIATLAHGKLQAGRHQVIFDASPFSSGVYFYRLQTSEFSQTRRLIFVK